MSATTRPQILIWENPANFFNISIPVSVTWTPSNFNTKDLGIFDLNMWLLRADLPGVTVLKSYPPILIAGKHNVTNPGVLFSPSADDLDIGVVQGGVHQLMWELYDDNTAQDIATISAKAFSIGFQFRVDPSSSMSSSQTTTSTSASSGTSAAAPNTATPAAVTTAAIIPSTSSAPRQGTIIGLSAGLGFLLAALPIGGLFLFFRHRKAQAARKDDAASNYPSKQPNQSQAHLYENANANANVGLALVQEGYPAAAGGHAPSTGKNYAGYEPLVEARNKNRELGAVEAGRGRRSPPPPAELAI